MSLTHWDPFRELEEVHNQLNRMFGRSAPARTTDHSKDALPAIDWSPSIDIAETGEEFQLKAELPEVKKEDLKVAVENGVLRIEGEPKVHADFKDGVLDVRLPKTAVVKPAAIKVHVE